MQATLIYNPNAGSTGNDQNDQIDAMKEALREAGYHPVYKETNGEDDLDAVLVNVEGLVVSAGGDGTARAVIMRILNQENAHFTPLPMGTANDVCHSLVLHQTNIDG